MAPLKPPFPRWYNSHTRCDYHGGNPGHSTENYTALKYKVQDLINLGKLKFEESNGLVRIEDLFGGKVEMIRQEEKTLKEIGSEKMAIQKDEVPIAKVQRSEAGSSSTTEGSKERSREPNKKEEKKMLQNLVWNLERILNEQNEYIIALKKEHNGQTLKQ